jgi:Flp pilus assembly protein TadG
MLAARVRSKSIPGKISGVGQEGAALIEFALVLPLLLILVMGIVDFGLYFYNDLLLTQAARDAARFASVGDAGGFDAAIASAEARLVSTSFSPPSFPGGSSGQQLTVALEATYSTITPLPGLIPGLGSEIGIDATATMRRE